MISTLSLHSFLLYFISLHQESRKSFQLVAKDDLKQNNKGLGWKLLVLLNLLLCFKLVPGQIFGQLYQRLLELISHMYIVCSLPSRMRREGSIVSMERMSLHCLWEGLFAQWLLRSQSSHFFVHLIQAKGWRSQWSPAGINRQLLQDKVHFSKQRFFLGNGTSVLQLCLNIRAHEVASAVVYWVLDLEGGEMGMDGAPAL